jgi:hypothetical protein
VAILQISSVRAPFTSGRLAHEAILALGRADAMGLLPDDQRIDALDLETLRRVMAHVGRAGIGKAIALGLDDGQTDPAARLEHVLEQLNTALEESPAPAYEWHRLVAVLGIELLARLLEISASSVRRYRASARTTPDDVAARLHFLALVVGDLGGAYNDFGIRQWFDRKRAQLGGRTPAELLTGGWTPAAGGPGKVRELARALTAAPGT